LFNINKTLYIKKKKEYKHPFKISKTMDRKSCILFYSNYSQHSLDVINYIKNIPLDFVTLVGLSFIAVDNNNFRQILEKQNITTVPTLIVMYYNGDNKIFEKDYIYTWIRDILQSISQTEDDRVARNNNAEMDTHFVRENAAENFAGYEMPNIQNDLTNEERNGHEGSHDASMRHNSIPSEKSTSAAMHNSVRLKRTQLNPPTNPLTQPNGVLPTTHETINQQNTATGIGNQTASLLEKRPKAASKKDITSLAMEIQKSRELDLKQIPHEVQPNIHPS